MDCFISLGYVQICIQPDQRPGAIWNPFGYTWSQSLPQTPCSEVSVHFQCSEVTLRARPLSLLPFTLRITHALGWSTPRPPPQSNLFLRVAEYGLRIQSFHLEKERPPYASLILPRTPHSRAKELSPSLHTRGSIFKLRHSNALCNSREPLYFLLVDSNTVVLKMSGYK